MQQELKLEPLYIKLGVTSLYPSGLPCTFKPSLRSVHTAHPCSILGMASAGLPSSSGSSALPRRHTLDNPSGTPFSHRPSNTTVQPIRDAWWSGPNRGLPLRSHTDSLVDSEWDDAIRRRHSAGMYYFLAQRMPKADQQGEDEFVASEVERALRYQRRAHSRRNSEISTLGASPTRDNTPSNGVAQTEGLFSTPATPNPRSPTHSRFLEYKAPAPLTPIELHHIQFPRGKVLSSSLRDFSPDNISL